MQKEVIYIYIYGNADSKTISGLKKFSLIQF